MLHLNVLGSLSLHSDGTPPPAAALQKRRLGLLAVLAVAGNRGLSRERLQALLWPESDAERSRHALDQLIYATRRALEVDPFLSEGHELRLDPETISTDISRFEKLVCEGNLEEAVAAYSGRLLDGVQIKDSRELETWLDSESARLHQRYQKALDMLASRAVSLNDHAQAIVWKYKLSASDPLSSRFALSLVEELIAQGDATAAIQEARAYQDRVRRELEVEPDPRIERAIAAISQPAVKAHRKAPASAAVIQSSPTGPATAHRSKNIWMVGFSIPVILIAWLAIAASQAERSNRSDRSQAEEAYRRGVNAWQQRSKTALDTAVVYFRRAAEIDPLYAEAESGLANAYVMIGYSGYRPGDAMFPKAKAAAQRAIQLDSTLAAPYAALGMELTWERDFNAAARAFQRAIALDPDYATAHQWYGILLRILGDIDGSVRETGKAAQLDPLSLQIQNNYATFLAGSGQKEAAMKHYFKMIAEEPDSGWVLRNPWLLTNMASIYAQSGKFAEAMKFARRAEQILPGHPRAVNAVANVYRAMGRHDLARAEIDRADNSNPHYAAYRAMFYAAENQTDSAFAWFDRVEDWGIPVLISLRGIENIRSDSRYTALLNRLGMNVRPPSN